MCVYCDTRIDRPLPSGPPLDDVSQYISGRYVIDLGARAVHALVARGASLVFAVSAEELTQQLPAEAIYVRDRDRNALLRVAAGHDCIDTVHVGEGHADAIPAAQEIFPRARIVGLCRERNTRRLLRELHLNFEAEHGSYIVL
jgi:hypothetical protein